MTVISELAIPFIDQLEEDCTVVDEAIYNGTTFCNVLAIAMSKWQKNKISSMPIVITGNALEKELLRNTVEKAQKINDGDCLFFINSIVSKFLTLGKPYDIEYPLFYIKIHDLNDDWMNNFLYTLKDIEVQNKETSDSNLFYYETKTYSCEKKKKYSSYTFGTDYIYENRIGRKKPDFSKLRFFYKENVLCIASMCPYTISGSDINKNNPMIPDMLKDIWKVIYESADFNNDNEEYIYQREKSLVSLTNYIMSFAHFMFMREAICEALRRKNIHDSEIKFYIEKQDLIYITGNELAHRLIGMLDKKLKEDNLILDCFIQQPEPTPLMGEMEYSMIPAAYSKNYYESIGADSVNIRKRSVSTVMSSIFSSMHWNVEIVSRHDKQNQDKRLHIGETYQSINSNFLAGMNKKDMLIHQCMDSKIDIGTVVPNYICKHSLASDYWTRMFRSGENEDLYKDKLLRNVIFIVTEFLKLSKGTIMHVWELELILSLLYHYQHGLDNNETFDTTHTDKHERYLLWGVKICADFKNGMYQVLFEHEDGEKYGIIDYAIDCRVLSIDGEEYLSLCNTEYVENLKKANVWTIEEENTVCEHIRFAFFFMEQNGDLVNIREMLNYLFFDDMNYLKLIEEWGKDVLLFIDKNNMEDEMSIKSFNEIYEKLPGPYFILTRADKMPNDIYVSVKNHMKDVNEKFNTDLVQDKIIVTYYLQNLWLYYTTGATLRNFDCNKFLTMIDFSQMDNMVFDDNTQVKDWLMSIASFENIHSKDKNDVKDRIKWILNHLNKYSCEIIKTI